MADDRDNPKLSIFTAHGVEFTSESGDQLVGTCPFTGREGKFFVNRNNLLWDSKTASVSGNVNGFMHHIAEHYKKQITLEQLKALARDRGLPVEAVSRWEWGWTGSQYALPVREPGGTVTDIRLYRLRGRMMATAGASVGLLGAPDLVKRPTVPVFICEGEWDAIAWEYIRAVNSAEGVVVAVPGASIFKPGWVPWFSGRTVHTLYDNDPAGVQGDALAFKRLKTAVQRLTFTHWPPRPVGFDIRDWVIECGQDRRWKEAWRTPFIWFYDLPRSASKPIGPQSSPDPEPADPAPSPKPFVSPNGSASLDDVFATFKRWLFLRSTDAISIMLATVVSQRIDGEPIWMFLVGPPGSAKTETLNSLSLLDNVYMTSSLTPHSLISGANWKEGMDPSLIPKLNGKVMIIKDFTSILSLRDTEKDEIFGILRDAYDGKCGKEFGNGVVRNYESRFTMLAAVTPSIYALSSSHTALGERFLKFAVSDNLNHDDEQAIVSRAIDNIDVEGRMRKEMAEIVQRFISTRTGAIHKATLPSLTPEMKTRIIYLARWGARMRGSITRDGYRNDIVTSRPSAEVGSRLGKQLAKLAQSLAVVHGEATVTNREYRLVRKVMVDTIPQRIEDVLRTIFMESKKPPFAVTSNKLSELTRYPHATIIRLLQDMNVLNVVERVTLGKAVSGWRLSAYIMGLLNPSDIYRPDAMTRLTLRRGNGRKPQ